MRWRAIFLIWLSIFALFAGSADQSDAWNHGLNTTFDPNQWGGAANVSCITAAIPGTCATGYNATCDGTGSDAAAWAAWEAASAAANPALAVLLVPPGKTCVLDGTGTNGCLTSDCSVHNTAGVQNAVIWGYGAQVNQGCRVGGWGFFDNNTSQALINAATAGAAAVTVNDGNVGRFSVGRWIAVTALGIQSFGDPPNFAIIEYKRITAINGNVVSLDSALKNSYKSTYPQLDLGDSSTPNLGGLAQIYLLEPSWDTDATIIGLSINCAGQLTFVGRNITLQNVVSLGTNGTAFSVGITHTVTSSELGPVEYDKDLETGNFNYITSGQFAIQSQAGTINITNSTLRAALNGTATNTNLTNVNILSGGIRAGPTCCGQATSLTLNKVTFTPALLNLHHTLISAYSLSGGTLTIAKSSGEYSTSVSMWVPGHKYFMGDSDGSNTCSVPNTFTVSDVVDAGSNVQILTDIVSIPVTNICLGTRPPSTFGSYQVMSLSVTNSGPANLLSNPEMTP